MTFILRCLLSVVVLAASATVGAQAPTGDALPAVEPLQDARKAGDKLYRYPLPAVAHTVRELQHAAQAMILREYCADRQIPDEFVSQRLAEFSRQTGRPEDCRTLLEYF